MAAEEVGWGDDEDDAASPTAAGGQPPTALAPALATTAAAANATAPAITSPVKTSAAAGSLPGSDQAPAESHSEPGLRPSDEHPAPDPDEVATASDSTDGAGAGERWTVVSTGTPTTASLAAGADLGASAGAAPPELAAITEGDTERLAAPSKATPYTGGAEAAVDAAVKSPVKPAVAEAVAPRKPVADDSDDDLEDVDVPDDGGSDVDEDWGDISD